MEAELAQEWVYIHMQGLAPMLILMSASVRAAWKSFTRTDNDLQLRKGGRGEAKLALLLWSGCVYLLGIL